MPTLGLLPWQRPYTRHPEALPPAVLAQLRTAILDAPYMAANNLNARFSGTYGFSVACRRDGLDDLRAAFEAFGPFLDLALDPRCNAFFLNPLLIADGAAVAPHRDKSLHSYSPELGFPRRVSVLYVSVPEGLEGGDLQLFDGDRPLAALAPAEGTLLHFHGQLRHAVAAVRAGAPDPYTARMSLVIEQYRVPKRLLDRVPRMAIGSRREAPRIAPLSQGAGEGAFGDAVREFL